MTQVTISASSGSGWVKVFVDNHEILSGPGTTTVSLQNGVVHYITYFVQGAAGQTFSIKVLSPSSVASSHNGTLNSTGKSTGQFSILIP